MTPDERTIAFRDVLNLTIDKTIQAAVDAETEACATALLVEAERASPRQVSETLHVVAAGLRHRIAAGRAQPPTPSEANRTGVQR